MDFEGLLAGLSRAGAWGPECPAPEVRHTHISAVFLTGDRAFKVKKPRNLGFLDFTTLEARRHFCHEEVRLNRRLAPTVYLAVREIVQGARGPRLGGPDTGEGPADALEYAVEMRRLPDDHTFLALLKRGRLDALTLDRLARRLIDFYARAEAGPHIAAFGEFDVVLANHMENFDQIEPSVGRTVSLPVFDRLRDRTLEALEEQRGLIERRAREGVPRDTHGDLHLEHAYALPEPSPPDNIVVIDCVEFNERFRYSDPVADVAFMAMDLLFHGRGDLAHAFAEQVLGDDPAARGLLRLYMAYRAVVRGKVDGFQASAEEVPTADRAAALASARGHLVLALGILEAPQRRPGLVLVGGLPGSGKTTLARALEEDAGFERITADAVRKDLAGLGRDEAGGDRLYTRAWNDRTYAECLRRAEAALFDGRRVVVDATFRLAARREVFRHAAVRWRVPFRFLECRAPRDEIRARLGRRAGDWSDADWDVYRRIETEWEAPDRGSAEARVVDTGRRLAATVRSAVAILAEAGLAEGVPTAPWPAPPSGNDASVT